MATTHQEHCRVYGASARYPTHVTWLLGSWLCVLNTPDTFPRLYPGWALSFHDTTVWGQGDSEVWIVMSSYIPLSLSS